MENNRKILLVEDDLNFGAVLKDYLVLNDFEVTLAKNGMEGFEKFKKDRRYEDFGNHVYHKLDARGMITFTNEVKHGFMKQARQNIEARNNPATASSLPERNKMRAFLDQLEAGDDTAEAAIRSEAKKIALVEYFRGLVEMGVEINELLTN